MFKNYLIIAWRNFRRHQLFSVINISSLSIGIAASLVIFMIVSYEFNFDKFEKDHDRIYRVVTDLKFSGTRLSFSGVPAPLPVAARNEVSGLETTVAFRQYSGDANVTVPVTNAGKPPVFKHQPDIIFTDENYFNLIPYTWLAGSVNKALKEPFAVVLSEQRARAYFPEKNFGDIIGRTIIYDDSLVATVSGVVKKLDNNTDFIFKEFISLATIPASGLRNDYSWNEWGSVNSNSQMFIKSVAGNSPAKIEAQLMTLLKKYNKDANKDDPENTVFHLQPLADLHFNSGLGTFGDHSANKPTLYGLIAVGAFLLLLGCLNFINLTTAQATQRAKEIGIRKTMGSSITQLMIQFLNETYFITLIATFLSIALIPLLLKVFADFIPGNLHFDLLGQPAMIIFLIGLVILVGFISGFYPALVLSRYNPALVLKNQVYSGTGSSRKAFLRKSLTVTQFFIAQVFVIATAITVRQINFLLTKDMGFKKDAIIYFTVPFHPATPASGSDNRRAVLMNELKSIPGIEMVSAGQAPPSSTSWSLGTVTYRDGKKEIQTDVSFKAGDTNYLKLYHIKLLAGRNVEPSDTIKEYVINETYLHILGFQQPQDVLNKNINGKPIVGVMSDFNQQSLHAPVKPLAFSTGRNGATFHIALKPQDAGRTLWKNTIARIETAFKKIYPGEELDYEFFDASIAKFYKSEQDISRLLKWATGLAVFISCLGLLGLVIYTTHLRTKEIGIRKVLGASVAQVVSLLSKDFILLVLVAFVLAAPVAWWAMHKWLDNFVYRTPISAWIFLFSGGFMIIIALITLSIQTVRSARANPVKSLRTE